ncbi:hypothetical protein ACLB1M_35160 [Escherichia coli]
MADSGITWIAIATFWNTGRGISVEKIALTVVLILAVAVMWYSGTT